MKDKKKEFEEKYPELTKLGLGEPIRVTGVEPDLYHEKDELDGVTKEMWDATAFPKLSKRDKRKLKKLNFGKIIVYGTSDRK